MSAQSSIEWTDATWNPVTGCTKVTPGCDNCYAETFAERWRGVKGHHFETGFDVTLRPNALTLPLKWRKPRRVFVNSMSDLFHKDVPDEYIARVFAVMALTPQHTYQVLTKRHGRMRSLIGGPHKVDTERGYTPGVWFRSLVQNATREFGAEVSLFSSDNAWPLPNVWLGVSVEDQQRADLRIPALLDTPAVVRFLSCEPLLGPVDLSQYLDRYEHKSSEHRSDVGNVDWYGPRLGWVIVGGESGPGARPMHPQWARDLRDQCTTAGVPYFLKQWGAWADRIQLTGDDRAAVSIWDEKRIAYVHPADGRTQTHGDWGAQDHREGWACMQRVGKGRAGRELDGRTWDEMPTAEPALTA